MNKTYHKTIIKALKAIKENFKEKDSMYFLSESDLKCALYHELISSDKELYKYDFATTKNNNSNKKVKIQSLYTEVDISNENEKSKFCDLAIIESNEIRFEKELKNNVYSWRLGNKRDNLKDSVFIELKFSYEKSSKSIIKEIKTDRTKLNNKVRESNKYIIYLDIGSKIIKDKKTGKIESLNKNKDKLRVIYIPKEGNCIGLK